MKYKVTEEDKNLLLQSNLRYKIKIEVTDKKHTVMDTVYGVSNIGSFNVNSESMIRRTINMTLKLDDFIENIEAKIASWIGLYYEVYVGIMDNFTDDCHYYPCGRYVITAASTVYDATTNSITFDLSDRFAELDGTRNGQQGGAPTISIPKEVDGKKTTIRGCTINIIKSSTDVESYIIDDVGEFNGMPQNNPDYEEYRKLNDEWNILPYDLSFSSGSTMSSILTEIRDLYPNCQMYFDVYDNFCYDMIPSLDNNMPDLDNDYLQEILLSSGAESVTYDIGLIKNVTEIFGKTYDIQFFSTADTLYKDNTYLVDLNTLVQSDGTKTESEVYTDYQKYDKMAFTCPENNLEAPKLNVNELGEIPIYYEFTTTPLKANEILKGDVCAIEIYKTDDDYFAYYLGEYQPHALCVLTADENDPKYTKEYFANKYNVKEKNIVFRVAKFNPFTVQKLGEILDSQTVEEIISDSVCRDNAKHNNYKSSTINDTVVINTIMMPWLDVNTKVNYCKLQEGTTYSYIITSISHNFSSGTSSITMYRFKLLYE